MDRIEAVGTLEPDARVVLAAQTSGIVGDVRVDLGERVRRGDILGGLDPREFELRVARTRAALEQTKALFEKARDEHRRAVALHAEKVLSAQDLDRARAELRVAEANRQAAATEVAIAEKHLGDSVLRSPVDGAVAKRHVNLGEFIATNEPAVEIVADDPLRLRVAVSERLSSSLQIGLPLTLEVDSHPGERFAATISRIGADVDTHTRTITLEADVPNADGRLKTGQFARATLDLGAKNAVLVPRASVLTFSGTNRVFVVGNDGTVDSRVVVTGRDLGEEVVIVEGVAAGERVAVSHLDRLATGMRVAVSEAARS